MVFILDPFSLLFSLLPSSSLSTSLPLINLPPHTHTHNLLICSGGSQLPGLKDTQAALWQGLCGKELRLSSSGGTKIHQQVCELGSRFSSPSQAFGWLNPQPVAWLQPRGRSWARTTQLSCSWIPNPQKLWNHVYCLQLLSFGVICYTAIINIAFWVLLILTLESAHVCFPLINEVQRFFPHLPHISRNSLKQRFSNLSNILTFKQKKSLNTKKQNHKKYLGTCYLWKVRKGWGKEKKGGSWGEGYDYGLLEFLQVLYVHFSYDYRSRPFSKKIYNGQVWIQ